MEIMFDHCRFSRRWVEKMPELGTWKSPPVGYSRSRNSYGHLIIVKVLSDSERPFVFVNPIITTNRRDQDELFGRA